MEHNKEKKIMFNTNKFKRPYTTPRKGRGKSSTYAQSPLWQQDIAPKMWDKYKKTGCTFELVWGPANTFKSGFAVNFGEALPFKGHNVIVSHTNNIKDQHQEIIDHWNSIGLVDKITKSLTIQQIYAWVIKLGKGLEIDEQDKDFILGVEFMTVDEVHRYSKGAEAKMLKTICDYMKKNGKLKLIIGTTMTGKYINTIWEWAGTFVTRAKYTFRPDIVLLNKDGMAYPNNAEYIHCDKKTKVFDKDYTDSLNLRVNDPGFEQHCKAVYNTDEDNAVDNLIVEKHKLRFRESRQDRIERLKYQDLRVEVSIDHWKKYEKGNPAIINVAGIKNAQYYEEQYEKIIQALGYDIIHWNSESKNAHPTYKNDERKMLNDLCDPTHPLKLVITNGMLREGTNEDIAVVYQCAFSTNGAEVSIQLGNRGKITVIMLDAMNTSKMAKNTGVPQALGEQFADRTQEELDAVQCEQRRQDAQHSNALKKNAWDLLNKDMFDHFANDPETTDTGAGWQVIISRDIWVADVEYIGNHKTTGISMHQNLIDALDLFGEAVDV
jgi:hypothetical protein|tara:strand:+ start:902 stop:2548 length:1647 start_codon:yes stop_codon:yes gene_type:complete